MEKESKFLRDSDGYVSVRVMPQVEMLPATEKDSMFGRDTNGNIAIRVIGGSGSVTPNNVILTAKEMEVPREEILGRVCMFIGTTGQEFTHGYIYECIEDGTERSAIIGFDPAKIGFDYTKGKLSDFFEEYNVPDYWTVVSGEMTYLAAGDLWSISGKDQNGDTVFEELKLYTGDLENSGFVFLNPSSDYKDGETLEYYMSWSISKKCEWSRIQP